MYSPGLSFLQKANMQKSDDESPDYTKSVNNSECDVSLSSLDTFDTIGFCFTGLSSSRYHDLDEKYVSLVSTWILLDTQSNRDVFKNKNLLKDIHEKQGEQLILKSNGGKDICTSQVGNICGYGKVWFQ